MKLRAFNRPDLSEMATLHSECNKTDVLGRFMYKNIETCPTSYRWDHLQFLRWLTLRPNSVTYVVETEPSDYVGRSEQYHGPEVIGFATYMRSSADATSKNLTGQDWLSALERTLIDLEQSYRSWFPSVRPAFHAENFKKARVMLSQPFDPEIFAEHWYLDTLMVHPNWQRKGVGKILIQKGFEMARVDRVPVLLKAAPKAGAAYRASGFRPFASLGMAQFYDELEFGGESSQKWVWEPELVAGDTIEGRWYERIKAKLEEADKAKSVDM